MGAKDHANKRLPKTDDANRNRREDDELELLAWRLSRLKPANVLPPDVADNPDFLAFQADDGKPTWADLYDVEDYLLAQPETLIFRRLAARLGVSMDEMWRYIGPQGAVKIGRLLDKPGYGGMFDLLGAIMRGFRRP